MYMSAVCGKRKPFFWSYGFWWDCMQSWSNHSRSTIKCENNTSLQFWLSVADSLGYVLLSARGRIYVSMWTLITPAVHATSDWTMFLLSQTPTKNISVRTVQVCFSWNCQGLTKFVLPTYNRNTEKCTTLYMFFSTCTVVQCSSSDGESKRNPGCVQTIKRIMLFLCVRRLPIPSPFHFPQFSKQLSGVCEFCKHSGCVPKLQQTVLSSQELAGGNQLTTGDRPVCSWPFISNSGGTLLSFGRLKGWKVSECECIAPIRHIFYREEM